MLASLRASRRRSVNMLWRDPSAFRVLETLAAQSTTKERVPANVELQVTWDFVEERHGS